MEVDISAHSEISAKRNVPPAEKITIKGVSGVERSPRLVGIFQRCALPSVLIPPPILESAADFKKVSLRAQAVQKGRRLAKREIQFASLARTDIYGYY